GSCGSGFAPSGQMRRIRGQPMVQSGAKLFRNFGEAHTAAFAVFFQPLDSANAFETVFAIERKCKWDGAFCAHGSHGAKTKYVFGKTEQHSAVTGTELQIDELRRFFLRKCSVLDSHKWVSGLYQF